MDDETRKFFQSQRKDKANRLCIDCNAVNPQWASVTYGCYICLECSGHHRHLGTHLTFVRSIDMDKWKELQLNLMKLGGNARFRVCLEKYGVAEGMSIEEKYNTEACAYYRADLRAQVDGTPLPQEPGIEDGRRKSGAMPKPAGLPASVHSLPATAAVASKVPEKICPAPLAVPDAAGAWLQSCGLCVLAARGSSEYIECVLSLQAVFQQPEWPVAFYYDERLEPASLVITFPRRGRCHWLRPDGCTAPVVARSLLWRLLAGDILALTAPFDTADVQSSLLRCCR